MKKILFGSAAALCAVAGLSSFKQIHRTFAGSHYFHVKATFGDRSAYKNSMVELGTQTDPGAAQFSCNAGDNKCVVVFSDNQITHTSLGATILKTNAALSQAPVSVPYTRTAI